MQQHLPADRYLLPITSNAPRTEILRFAQNDCRAGRLARNAVFILIDAKGVDTTTLSGQRPLSNFRTLAPIGRINLKNLFITTFGPAGPVHLPL